MRKLVSLKQIDKITPIIDSERLELAHIGGWQCVVSKNTFEEGEVAVFFEIDSALPADDERYKFLHSKCLYTAKHNGSEVVRVVRIRTMKLRGVLSQGLLMPVTDFPEVLTNIMKINATHPEKSITDIVDTMDLTDVLNVQNFDDIRTYVANLKGTVKWGGACNVFPTHLVPKTDAERIQNLPQYFDGRFEGVRFEATEKMDGTSATYIWAPTARPEEPRFMCSRNYELKLTDSDNVYAKIAEKYDIFSLLQTYCTINSIGRSKPLQLAIQGEICGPGVNGNKDKATEHTFNVFRIYNITDKEWLSPSDRMHICNMFRIPHVKVIAECAPFSVFTNMDGLLNHAKGTTKRGNPREGVVWKSMDGNITFKALNNDYLLMDK